MPYLEIIHYRSLSPYNYKVEKQLINSLGIPKLNVLFLDIKLFFFFKFGGFHA